MKLTAYRLCAVYEMLLSFPPFDRWGLPAPDKIYFITGGQLENGTDAWAEYGSEDGHTIHFDENRHWTMALLVSVMAHEMGHLRQELIGKRPAEKEQHNSAWKRIAAVICKEQGYDPETF
jgi:hypothetical protein